MATQDDFDWLYRRDPASPTPPQGEQTAADGAPVAPAPAPAFPPTAVQPVAGQPASQPTAPALEPQPAAPGEPLPPRPAPVHIEPAPPRPGSEPAAPVVPPRRPRPLGADGRELGVSAAGATAAHPRKKRKLWPWITFGLSALLIAGLVFLVAVPLAAWGRVAKIDDTPAGDRPANQPGTTFLLVGNDARGGLTAEEAKDLGVDTETAGDRTDTMLLLHVPEKGKPVLVSLPRDSFVAIPGHKKNKLNAAYPLGGAPLLIQTIEQSTGVRIDGYLEVGFGGFARVVQAIGGIDVCVQQEVPGSERYPGIKPGCQKLDTKQALWFVRNRSSRDGQDIGRTNRQRQFLSAAIKGVISPATFLNPARYAATADAFAKAMGVGKSTQMGDMITLAKGLQEISKGNGYSVIVPVSSYNTRTSAGSSVLWDKEKAREMFGMLAKGDTTGIEKFAK